MNRHSVLSGLAPGQELPPTSSLLPPPFLPSSLSQRTIVHLNIIGFKAAVASAKDKTLHNRPFVIAGASGGRALALDCSPEAIAEGVSPGTALAVAERKIPGLTILAPDIAAYAAMNTELERIAAIYAPEWENDRSGNLYLDISGTAGLFGPAADASSRILRLMLEQTGLRPAAAVASNKLVSKVATRTIRPTGLIQVHSGTEAEFLCHQDIRILPGMGPGLLRTAAVTGITEIGEIAALTDSAAAALFGKQGTALRRMAQGIDSAKVEGNGGEKRITQQADFAEDTIDETAIQGAIAALAEHGGFTMRSEKKGAAEITVTVIYSDGISAASTEKSKRLKVTDHEITAAAQRVYRKTATRRIRIRSVSLTLTNLTPLGYEADLFEIETETKGRKLQTAVDAIQTRYGIGAVSRGMVLAGKKRERVEGTKHGTTRHIPGQELPPNPYLSSFAQ